MVVVVDRPGGGVRRLLELLRRPGRLDGSRLGRRQRRWRGRWHTVKLLWFLQQMLHLFILSQLALDVLLYPVARRRTNLNTHPSILVSNQKIDTHDIKNNLYVKSKFCP
jgi:hypothetical protein